MNIMNKEWKNAIDRLFDDVRFSEDKKNRKSFMKTLKLLVKTDYVKKRVYRKAALEFMKIAKSTADPIDKAYSLGWAGRCYEDYGDNRLAATCYAAASELAPSDTFAAERLGDYFWESDSAESVRQYNRVLEYDPVCSRAYYKLGKLHSNLGEFDKAVDRYQKAIEVHNGYIAPIAEAAIEYAKKGDKENTIRMFFLAMANDVYEFEKLEEALLSCLNN